MTLSAASNSPAAVLDDGGLPQNPAPAYVPMSSMSAATTQGQANSDPRANSGRRTTDVERQQGVEDPMRLKGGE
jgi:hypothetical protein